MKLNIEHIKFILQFAIGKYTRKCIFFCHCDIYSCFELQNNTWMKWMIKYMLCINTHSSVHVTLFPIIIGPIYHYFSKIYICRIWVVKLIQGLLIDSSDCTQLIALTQDYLTLPGKLIKYSWVEAVHLIKSDESINSYCISIGSVRTIGSRVFCFWGHMGHVCACCIWVPWPLSLLCLHTCMV